MNKKKKAFITGITGQDGSFLAEYLLEQGYNVYGIIRRSSSFNTKRIDHIFNKLNLDYCDLSESGRLYDLLNKIRPDEIYNLAAQSHVRVSFDEPEYTSDITGLGTLRILECIRRLRDSKFMKFYQASSSEMFGGSNHVINEKTPFNPRSPYAAAKVYSFYVTKNYREAYKIFACNGILFNHESERRGETFVTRKITKAVSRIYYGLQNHIVLGNLNAMRDWGYAKDYVKAMYMMLQHKYPDDYVIATHETHTVKEFLFKCFDYVNMNPVGKIKINLKKYGRPTEVDMLLGNYSKARDLLGWKPETSFSQLVKIMMDHDLEEARKEKRAKNDS